MDAGLRDHLNPNPRWTLPAEQCVGGGAVALLFGRLNAFASAIDLGLAGGDARRRRNTIDIYRRRR